MRIEHDLPMREYQAQPELSASDVKAINENPDRWKRTRGRERTPTPAMILGSATHAFILGDDDDVVALDVENFRTVDARTARDAALAAGKYPLTNEQHDQARAMADAAKSNPEVARLIRNGKSEVSFFTEDPITGQPMRGRVDWADENDMRIVDFKTTDSADPERFARHAGNMKYQVSAAHYGDSWGRHAGTEPWEVLFVLIEREYPHTTSVCRLGPGSLELGRQALQRGIRRYRKLSLSDQWATPWPGITTVDLPKYEFYAEDER
jgi:PDDEXK-like uncharacterized protein DUF3799